jgi:hypothetical protein
MTSNEDPIRRVRGISPNSSVTVDGLLVVFDDSAEAGVAKHDRRIAVHIAANEALVGR